MAQGDLFFRIRAEDTSQRAIAALVSNLKAVGIQADRVRGPIRGVSRELRRAQTSALALNKSMISLGTAMRFLGGFAGVVGVIGLGRFLGRGISESVRVFADFEHQLAEVRGLIRDTGTEALTTEQKMRVLSQRAQELGISTVFSAKQVAQAMGEMARAGLTTAEIMDAVQPALNLAAAGGLEMAEASQIATRIMRGLKVEGQELTKIMDLIALTASRSTQTVKDIGQAMSFAASAASLAGVSVVEMDDAAENATIDFLDLAAGLAVVANAGIKGTIAGTAFRKGLTQILALARSGKGAIGAIAEEITIVGEDGELKLRPLVEVFRVFEQRGISALDMFQLLGVRAGNTFAVLRNLGSEGLAQVIDKLRDFEGFAERLAEDKLDSLRGDTIKLKSAFDGFRIALGEGVSPQLRALVQAVTGAIRALTRSQTVFRVVQRSVTFFADVLLRAAQGVNLWIGRWRLNIEVMRQWDDLIKSTLLKSLSLLLEGFNLILEPLSRLTSAAAAIADARGFGGLAETLDQVSEALDLSDKISLTEDALGAYQRRIDASAGSLQSIRDQHRHFSERLEELRKNATGSAQDIQTLEQALNKYKDRLDDIQSRTQRLAEGIDFSELLGFSATAKDLDEAVKLLSATFTDKGFADIFGEGSEGLSKFESDIKRAQIGVALADASSQGQTALLALRDFIDRLVDSYRNSIGDLHGANDEFIQGLLTLQQRVRAAEEDLARTDPYNFLRIAAKDASDAVKKTQAEIIEDIASLNNVLAALEGVASERPAIRPQVTIETDKIRDQMRMLFQLLDDEAKQQAQALTPISLIGETTEQEENRLSFVRQLREKELELFDENQRLQEAIFRGSELEQLKVAQDTTRQRLQLILAIIEAKRAEALASAESPEDLDRIQRLSEAQERLARIQQEVASAEITTRIGDIARQEIEQRRDADLKLLDLEANRLAALTDLRLAQGRLTIAQAVELERQLNDELLAIREEQLAIERDIELEAQQEGIDNRLDIWLAYFTRLAELQAVFQQKDIELERDTWRTKSDIARERLRAVQKLLNEAFNESKALAVANIIINTADAIMNALATKPFVPKGLAMAALAAATGAAQLAKVKSTKFQFGGIIPGRDRGIDDTIFLGRPGEAVLPRDLTNLLLDVARRDQDRNPMRNLTQSLVSSIAMGIDRAVTDRSPGGARVFSSAELAAATTLTGGAEGPITINFNPTIQAPVDPRGTQEALEDSWEALSAAMERVVRRGRF